MTISQQQHSASPQGQVARVPAWDPPHYVKSLSLAIPAVLLGFQISGWAFAMLALQQGRTDFRSQYTAGYMMRSGNAHRIYDYSAQLFFQNRLVVARDMALPFDHLSYEALLFVPFSYLPFRAAYFAMLAFNLVVLALSVRLMRRWTSTLDGIYPWLSFVMAIVFLPTALALMQGQDSILLLFCLVAAFLALEGGREFLAGVLLSLGLFKFQIVLSIALLFLLWKRWRFSAGFSLSAAVLVASSLALIGREAATSYFRLLLSMSMGLSSTVEQSRLGTPPAIMPNLRGLAFGLLNHRLPMPWIQTVIVVLSAICVVAAWIGGSRTRKGSSLLIAIPASAAVSYHFHLHDMTILLLPILVWLDQCIQAVPHGDLHQRRVAQFGALLFTFPVIFGFAPGHFYLTALVICGFLFVALRWKTAEGDFGIGGKSEGELSGATRPTLAGHT
jgi:Glycosyltransferase family 87